MRLSCIALVLASALALPACGSGNPMPMDTDGSEAGSGETGGEGGDPAADLLIRSDVEPDLDPAPSTEVRDAWRAAELDVGVSLYGELRTAASGPGNVIFSPTSVRSAFSLLYLGAVDSTLDNFASVFGFDADLDVNAEMFNWMFQRLVAREDEGSEEHDPTIIIPGHSVWMAEGITPEPSFLDRLALHYDTGVYAIDFFGDPMGAEDLINDWVGWKTNELIPDLFSGQIRDTTAMVLVNTIYLKTPWLEPFEESLTSPISFTTLDGPAVEVPAMHAYGLDLSANENADYVSVTVPFHTGLAATFILPTDFNAFVGGLDATTLGEALVTPESRMVDLVVPKLDTRFKANILPQLETLGLIASGDFTGTGAAGSITDVIHEVVVKMDEKGTEAAAATGIVVGDTGGFGDPLELRLDRPYLMAITDPSSGALLFFGSVADPSL
ncbi:Serpin [Enhygromyxa salina]|uniref:Serpin n=1 Tax=Enhygromyxa salina TaxID=215803 RepID=A0A2S9XEE5_9BACT|nr:serpin family protein [Enhygromyxa salina]PRP91120.1 Serpin [Enhygromyxa salina]